MNNRYMAGFFDADGCIFMRKCKKGNATQYAMEISIGQKYPEVLHMMYKETGLGTIRIDHIHGRSMHYWRIGKREQVEEFIDRIYRHTILKKPQLTIAKQYFLIPKGIHGYNGLKAIIYTQLKEAKREPVLTI